MIEAGTLSGDFWAISKEDNEKSLLHPGNRLF